MFSLLLIIVSIPVLAHRGHGSTHQRVLGTNSEMQSAKGTNMTPWNAADPKYVVRRTMIYVWFIISAHFPKNRDIQFHVSCSHANVDGFRVLTSSIRLVLAMFLSQWSTLTSNGDDDPTMHWYVLKIKNVNGENAQWYLRHCLLSGQQGGKDFVAKFCDQTCGK